MSPKSAKSAGPAKRVPYRPPRDRRELWTAIAVATLIVVVTASLVWFVRPNRESAPTAPTPTAPAATAPTIAPTASTEAPVTDTTAPTEDTTAPAGG